MLKTAAEVLAAQDPEQAFLFMIMNHESTGGTPPTGAEIEAIMKLAEPWFKEVGEEEYSIKALIKLTTDEGRRILLKSLIENQEGFGTLARLFADDRAAAHRQLVLDFFIEHCDDPGYFDEMLDQNMDRLTEAQKLQLIEGKRRHS